MQLFPGTVYSPGSPLGASELHRESERNLVREVARTQNGDGYATVYDFGTGGTRLHMTTASMARIPGQRDAASLSMPASASRRSILPGEAFGGGAPQKPINFGWKDKIAPRIGVAWDVFRNGKMKVFGGYGVFYDQMKLNVAISSFGGQYWNNCTYILSDVELLDPAIPSSTAIGRYCPIWRYFHAVRILQAAPLLRICVRGEPQSACISDDLRNLQRDSRGCGSRAEAV